MRISLRNFKQTENPVPVAGEPRKGFILVEIIVAMVILAIAVSSLAALMYSVSQSGIVATGNAYRNGVLMHEVNRLVGTPYDSVAVGSSETQVSTLPYPHRRIVTISEPVANVVKVVQIVIIPANVRHKPDTVSFTRTKARTSRALCKTCPQG